MYVVTFYSFKGGVGRTMALVNLAVSLAGVGKRVLIADFDLEAPGLPSYETFNCAHDRPGIVDYVTSYRATSVAPNVGDYIVEAMLDDVRLWVLPAGRHTERGYTDMLNDIDWQDLYENQSGYLMFEDMRAQWAQYQGRGFDYVLIDSRTGHTDVGGICTRQLPDSVVILFVPNNQNIDGLVPIVESIRQEKERGGREIELLFCPSNVPDLDDERDILRDLLRSAEQKLGYSDPATIIHHYSSLEVLKQTAFIKRRATSKLSRQYHELNTAIIKRNLEDPEGVIVALADMPTEFEHARIRGDNRALDNIRTRAAQIRALHPKDGKIALHVAGVFNRMGDTPNELAALSVAIETGHEATRARSHRGQAHAMLGQMDDAIADFRQVLASPAAKPYDVLPALYSLAAIDEAWESVFVQTFQRQDITPAVLSLIASWLETKREFLPTVADKMFDLLESGNVSERDVDMIRNHLTLALIGSGDFSAALDQLSRTVGDVDTTFADGFNLAMARWGRDGAPPVEELRAFADSRIPLSMRDSANVHQCLALAHAVSGNPARAEEELLLARREVSGGLTFSCWRFLNVYGAEFQSDLDEMANLLATRKSLSPPFLTQVSAKAR